VPWCGGWTSFAAAKYWDLNGFWGGRFEKCYTDIRVFNPLAASNSASNLQSTYRKHESLKKRVYESRLREMEHSYFTPLVFSATGGMGHESTMFYKRLASLPSDAWKEPYTGSYSRCRISFCLLRSAIQCIKGARSSKGQLCKVRSSCLSSVRDSVLQLTLCHSNLSCIFYFCEGEKKNTGNYIPTYFQGVSHAQNCIQNLKLFQSWSLIFQIWIKYIYEYQMKKKIYVRQLVMQYDVSAS